MHRPTATYTNARVTTDCTTWTQRRQIRLARLGFSSIVKPYSKCHIAPKSDFLERLRINECDYSVGLSFTGVGLFFLLLAVVYV